MSFDSALVTGASGFLGRALVGQLRAAGKRVIAAARPNTSRLPAADAVVRLEWPCADLLKDSIGSQLPEVVFHCAAYGVAPDARDCAEMFRTNVAAVGDWVEAAAGIGARAFVYAGSCSEYGAAAEGMPIGEDHPLAAEDSYGASKAAGGQWGRAVAHRVSIPFQWMRIFGVYGEGEAPHRLLPYLYRKLSAVEHVDLTPGLQWRDFLYVDDAARGMILGAECALQGKIGPFNLCSGRGTTVRTFAESVANAMGCSSAELLDFGARDYRPGEQFWMVGDPTRLAAASGFAPKFDLREGIALALGRISSVS